MATEITPGKAYGFFTDTSVCIGCKACEVACKEWNQLPEDEQEFGFLGKSLDNTGELNGSNWRHVQFIDNVPDETMSPGDGKAFLLMSDVCKHCQHASCLEVCRPARSSARSSTRSSSRRTCATAAATASRPAPTT
ncbi:MAG: formate dehydrogenase iron-sulfur subunit [Thermoleophilaceae bacterium]|nr:formate dehydrogenase iron-sulfur subunit [Thermoleophilaceae bacterium]